MPVSRFRRGWLPKENLTLLHADLADAMSIFDSVEVLTHRDTSYEDKNEYYCSYIIGIFYKWKLVNKNMGTIGKVPESYFFPFYESWASPLALRILNSFYLHI